jgi:hypothetical protein
MKKILFIVVCAFIVGCSSFVPKNTSDASDELRETILKAISLLETQQYDQYILLVTPPNELPEVLKDYGLAEMDWTSQREELALNMLKLVVDQTPELNEDGSIATFTIPKDLDPAGLLQLQKIDGKWYGKD